METEIVLTDTHTHLYYQLETGKLEEHMERSFEKNIRRIFLPNVNSKSISAVIRTTEKYPDNCFAMLGLHPCDVKENFLEELSIIRKAIQKYKIYAIGEIGIDLYWDRSTLEIQKEAFRTQIQWAKELNLPIDIHCREAFDEVFEVLDEMHDDKLYGVFHCFTGTQAQAQRAIDLGFALGIGGVVTFKKSGLDEVVKNIDLQHIVLETDAPYLAPVPFRGKENETSYVYYIAKKLAEIKGMATDDIAKVTTENSKRIFKI